MAKRLTVLFDRVTACVLTSPAAAESGLENHSARIAARRHLRDARGYPSVSQRLVRSICIPDLDAAKISQAAMNIAAINRSGKRPEDPSERQRYCSNQQQKRFVFEPRQVE